MALQQQIRARYSALSPALRRVAKHLLDHPGAVVTQSMRTVGVQSGSTPATLVRFAQQLGFAGWPQLKGALAQDLGLGADAYGARARQLVGRAREQGLAAEMFAVLRRNLEATQRHSAGALERVCALLEKAPAVHAAGFRACYPVAFSFVYQYRLFRPSVQLIDGQGGALEMQQRALARGDALLVVSFAPYSREALQTAEVARAAGCRVVALTDSAASPLSLVAGETLLFATESPSFFPSAAAGLALAEALVELLASRAGRAVVRHIDAAERQLYESGAYLQAPPPRT